MNEYRKQIASHDLQLNDRFLKISWNLFTAIIYLFISIIPDANISLYVLIVFVDCQSKIAKQRDNACHIPRPKMPRKPIALIFIYTR